MWPSWAAALGAQQAQRGLVRGDRKRRTSRVVPASRLTVIAAWSAALSRIGVRTPSGHSADTPPKRPNPMRCGRILARTLLAVLRRPSTTRETSRSMAARRGLFAGVVDGDVLPAQVSGEVGLAAVAGHLVRAS